MAVVYATPAQVAAFMGVAVTTLPTNILAMIMRAQELIDYITINKIMDYNLNNLGTAIEDADVALAAQNATSAQIEYWLNLGADTDIVNAGNISNFAIGNFSMSFGGSGSGSSNASMAVLAPRANRYLFLVGLMYRGVWRAY
jgi:hypothetical protein